MLSSIGPVTPGWLRFGPVRPFTLLSLLVACGLAGLTVYPLARVLWSLVFSDGRFEANPFAEVFAQRDLLQLLANTAIAVACSSVLGLLVGSLLAWITERTDARMGAVTDALPLLPFLLPPIAGAIGWVLLLSPRAGLLNAVLRFIFDHVGLHLAEGPLNIYSWAGLIFVYTVYQVPYAYLMVSAGLRNVDAALEEQSRVCGSGPLRTLRRVVLPAVRPSLGAALLLMIWSGFGLFSVPVIIGTGARIEVLPVRIVNALSFSYPPRMALAVGLSVFVVLTVGTAWFLQSRLLKKGRFATIGGRGHRATRTGVGIWKIPLRLFVVGYVALVALLPAAALLLVALNRFWSAEINWGQLSLVAFHQAIFDDAVTARALQNSLFLGVTGATLGIIGAAMVTLLVQRSESRLGRVLDGAIKLPSSISSIVHAMGFILVFSGPPFYLNGTLVILLLAYLALYLPQASVAADVALSQVAGDLSDASHVSGAGPGRTFRKITFPLALPGLAAGWALLFVRMTGDLTASSMLAGASNPVVGFRILEVFQNGTYSTLAALAALLTAVTSMTVICVLVLTKRRSGLSASVREGAL